MAFTKDKKRAIDIGVPAAATAWVAYAYIGKAKDREIKYILFVMILTFIGLYAVTTTVTRLFLEKALNGLGTSDKADVQTQYGLSSDDYQRCEEIAKTVYHAFHDGWSEDEAAAIDAIDRCTSVADVRAVSSIYSKMFGKSISADFGEFTGWWNGSPKALVTDNWS